MTFRIYYGGAAVVLLGARLKEDSAIIRLQTSIFSVLLPIYDDINN